MQKSWITCLACVRAWIQFEVLLEYQKKKIRLECQWKKLCELERSTNASYGDFCDPCAAEKEILYAGTVNHILLMLVLIV